jgi:hypothetical protein
MLSYREFINLISEAKTEARGILHLPHGFESAFHPEKKELTSTISKISDVASGKASLTRKIDDKISFQVKKTEDGKVGVKYKGTGAKYNFSQKDIEAQHGNKPHVAGPLSHILAHVHKVMPNKPGEYQGGFLSAPEHRSTENNHISYTPNTIKYSVPHGSEEGKKIAKSKVSLVIHSKLDASGKPSPVGAGEFKDHSDVHIMNHVVTPEERKLSPENKSKIDQHLNAVKELSKDHSHEHHVGHHDDLVSYGNSSFDTNKKLNVDDYKKFLTTRGQKKIDALKSDKGKEQKRNELKASLAHVDKHADKFKKSFEIYHHVQKATETLADSLTKTAHGGYKTHIGDKETGGEGFVSGNMKIVPRDFTVANRQRSAQFQATKAQVKK